MEKAARSKFQANGAPVLIILASLLWIFSTILSIYRAFNGGSILYVPEFIMIMITSLILLGWSANMRRFPHLAAKIGYLSILISVMNLLALAITGSTAHSINNIYQVLTFQYSPVALSNLPLFIAYVATAMGIVGGVVVIKMKDSFS